MPEWNDARAIGELVNGEKWASPAALADELGVSRSTVTRWRSGTRRIGAAGRVKLLALAIRPAWLDHGQGPRFLPTDPGAAPRTIAPYASASRLADAWEEHARYVLRGEPAEEVERLIASKRGEIPGVQQDHTLQTFKLRRLARASGQRLTETTGCVSLIFAYPGELRNGVERQES